MKRYIVAAVFILIASTAFAAEGTFDRSLSVSATPNVTVSGGSGYIHISAGSGNQVHITGRVRSQPGWFSGDSESRVKEIVAHPPIEQSGNTITIGRHDSDDLFRNVSIDYDVTLPRSTTLKAHNGSGDVRVSGVEHLLSAEAGSGSVHVDSAGANVQISSGSGNIEASSLGPNVEIHAGSGSIHATDIRGAASLQNGSGNQDLSLSAPGDITCRAGSGSIHIQGLSGGARITSGSGSLDVAGNPTSEWRLQTGSGSVNLTLDPSARFTLDASTGIGGVHVDRAIVMEGSLDRHHVSGKVNGGGPTLRVSTGSGAVTIR